ncbi:MAG: DUF4845 domain-containing protein [Thioalkalispiraceae bacterium]|jgi:hypothetical protein
MSNITKQRGMTAIGWLLVLAIVALFSIVALKLIPMYLDSFKVTSSLESLAGDPKAQGKSGREIRKLLMKRLDINMVSDVSASDISISRSREGTKVEVSYEARRALFGNLHMVLVYDKSVIIP